MRNAHAPLQQLLDETIRAAAAGEPLLDPARRAVIEACDVLHHEPVVALTHRTQPLPHAPSDDPRDYVSVGTYMWPNPDTPDGLPYVGRDGEFTPEFVKYDRPKWDLLADSVALLARAGVLRDSSADRSALIARLNTWFVDPDTRMNPHLRHAQMCPGHDTGRVYGIIDFSIRMPAVLDALSRLRAWRPDALPARTVDGVEAWLSALLDWLLSDEVTAQANPLQNNHGVFYDLLVIRLGQYLGRRDVVDDRLGGFMDRRLTVQIADDGSLPHELRRTRSFDYTTMTLWGLALVADAGVPTGLDLWHAQTPAGRCISDAVHWVYDRCCSDEAWTHQQLDGVQYERLVPTLLLANATKGVAPLPIEPLAPRLPEPLAQEPRLTLMNLSAHPWHPARLSLDAPQGH